MFTKNKQSHTQGLFGLVINELLLLLSFKSLLAPARFFMANVPFIYQRMAMLQWFVAFCNKAEGYCTYRYGKRTYHLFLISFFMWADALAWCPNDRAFTNWNCNLTRLQIIPISLFNKTAESGLLSVRFFWSRNKLFQIVLVSNTRPLSIVFFFKNSRQWLWNWW